MTQRVLRLLLFPLFLLLATPAGAEEENAADSVADLTEGAEQLDGFFPLYLHQDNGTVHMEFPAPGPDGQCAEFLYVHGLLQGLGSNPVGLDRGQISGGQVLRARKVGPKLVLEEINTRYRAISDNPDERRAVAESFATSILWAGEIAATADDGALLVDLTSFVVRDVHDVVATLDGSGQGSYSLDSGRSFMDFSGCFAFPDNVELQSTLTFSGAGKGAHVRSVTPTPESITLTAHVSFIRLPDADYRPRRFDSRVGVWPETYLDYAAPLSGYMDVRQLNRHRLEKTDPTAARSTAKKPIVFYVDRGAPEPVRSALVEGASWWAAAFEAAGFIDGFQVKILPEGVHPLDVRYNVITWVHRSTRGWSYGGGIIDPRTGEFIKGHVNLGSLRVRQDRLLFEGLLGAEKTGTGAADDPIELALARIRQLSAHEVGHSLGMAHNFAASTYDDRASVMDYPAPWITVGADGNLDASRAYGVGVGSWDSLCVRYAYSQFPPGADEDAELQKIVREAIESHAFLSDTDARRPESSDPRGNLWDNGTNATEELLRILEVRRIALDRFGERCLAEGRPVATLQEVLAPVYFHHRYQLDAAVKGVAGMEYSYAMVGDGQVPLRPLDGASQRAALDAVLRVLDPSALDLPEALLSLLPPRPYGWWEANRELFDSNTWPAFDALGAAATAADQAVTLLLHPRRLARAYDFHRRDPQLPGVTEIVSAVIQRALASPTAGEPKRYVALRHTVRRTVVDRMIATAARDDLRPDVRAELEAVLRLALGDLEGDRDPQSTSLAADVRRFLERGVSGSVVITAPSDAPPGSPIGMQAHGCSIER